MNLATSIEQHDPSRVALVDGDSNHTYGELSARAAELRAVLIDNGTITFLAFFQAFFAVFLGAFGVGQVPKKRTNTTLRKRFLCSAVPTETQVFSMVARSMLRIKNTHTRR